MNVILLFSNTGEHHHPDSLLYPRVSNPSTDGHLLPEKKSEARKRTSQKKKLRSGSRSLKPRSF